MVRNPTTNSTSTSPHSSLKDRPIFSPEVGRCMCSSLLFSRIQGNHAHGIIITHIPLQIIEEMRQEQRNMYLDPTLRAYCRDLVIALRAKDGVSGVTAKAGFDLLQGTL